MKKKDELCLVNHTQCASAVPEPANYSYQIAVDERHLVSNAVEPSLDWRLDTGKVPYIIFT